MNLILYLQTHFRILGLFLLILFHHQHVEILKLVMMMPFHLVKILNSTRLLNILTFYLLKLIWSRSHIGREDVLILRRYVRIFYLYEFNISGWWRIITISPVDWFFLSFLATSLTSFFINPVHFFWLVDQYFWSLRFLSRLFFR